MPEANAQLLGEFFDYFWEKEEGRVCLATMRDGDSSTFKQILADWPARRSDVIKYAQGMDANGYDVFYGPALYQPDAPSAELPYIKSVNVRWVDIDGGAPLDWAEASERLGVPRPTMEIQSSVEDRQHVYWRTERTSDIDSVQDTNRALAATIGADNSGWDGVQLLRIPGTHNYGFGSRGVRKPWAGTDGTPPATVAVRGGSPTRVVSDADFLGLREAERRVLERIEISDVPPIAEVLALASWSKELFTQFTLTQSEATDSSRDKRSGALTRLAYLAAESGLTDPQMYAVLSDTATRWDKYTDRSQAGRDKQLRDLIARARTKVGYTSLSNLSFSGLIPTVAKEVSVNPKIVYNYSEFMESDFKVDWMLENLMAVGGLGVIVGQPGVGKTTFAMNLAHDIALGVPKAICWENTRGPQKVVVLSLEMGPNELHHFMGNIAPRYAGEERALSKNLHIVPLGSPLHLDKPEGQSFVENVLSEYRPDLLLIDSLRNMVSKPMGDEMAMKETMEYISKIRSKYATAVFLIHHERKRSNDRHESSGDLSDMYGSQMLAAEVEYALALRERKDGKIVMSTYKNRLAKKMSGQVMERGEHMSFRHLGEEEFDGEDQAGSLRGATGFVDSLRAHYGSGDGPKTAFGL